MEILDLKFDGIPISTLLFIACGIWFCKKLFEVIGDWKERRQWRKEYNRKEKAWKKDHHWDERIQKWVRNDGKPFDDDAWNPVKALLERLEEKGRGSG
jgi:hypothetical protein